MPDGNIHCTWKLDSYFSEEGIQKLYYTVKPECGLIPIHTDAPEMFMELIPDGTFILLDDGETFCL